ncbi:MAG: chorismate mutase [Gemmatimonadaceae bacterium]|jgi:chorismate mutase|nr:chorismate mutase [Gemmatimonadaceae bacterium]
MTLALRWTDLGNRMPSEREQRALEALETARARVGAIDDQLVTLLAERQRLARNIGTLKREAGRPVLDPAREAAVLRRVTEGARAIGLDEDDVREVWRKILAMARKAQVDESGAPT